MGSGIERLPERVAVHISDVLHRLAERMLERTNLRIMLTNVRLAIPVSLVDTIEEGCKAFEEYALLFIRLGGSSESIRSKFGSRVQKELGDKINICKLITHLRLRNMCKLKILRF